MTSQGIVVLHMLYSIVLLSVISARWVVLHASDTYIIMLSISDLIYPATDGS